MTETVWPKPGVLLEKPKLEVQRVQQFLNKPPSEGVTGLVLNEQQFSGQAISKVMNILDKDPDYPGEIGFVSLRETPIPRQENGQYLKPPDFPALVRALEDQGYETSGFYLQYSVIRISGFTHDFSLTKDGLRGTFRYIPRHDGKYLMSFRTRAPYDLNQIDSTLQTHMQMLADIANELGPQEFIPGREYLRNPETRARMTEEALLKTTALVASGAFLQGSDAQLMTGALVLNREIEDRENVLFALGRSNLLDEYQDGEPISLFGNAIRFEEPLNIHREHITMARDPILLHAVIQAEMAYRHLQGTRKDLKGIGQLDPGTFVSDLLPSNTDEAAHQSLNKRVNLAGRARELLSTTDAPPGGVRSNELADIADIMRRDRVALHDDQQELHEAAVTRDRTIAGCLKWITYKLPQYKADTPQRKELLSLRDILLLADPNNPEWN
jgi:hypothetical protein